MGKSITIAALLLVLGQGAAFSATYWSQADHAAAVAADTVKAKTAHSCCADSTIEDHTTPYHKIAKDSTSVQEGLFCVRHVKDKWYWEIPDSLLGRLMLAVTRFTSVPQGFRMLSGEEAGHSSIYFDLYNEQTLFMREYVQTAYAKEEHNIGLALRQSTADPVVYRFDVIGRNPKTKALLIDVTKLLLTDNKVTSLTGSNRTLLSIGQLQADRTFIDTMKVYPINIEIQTLRTYAMNPGKVPASSTGSATLTLNTSIVVLPKVPMQPRLFDERVGYFNNRVLQFSDDDAPEHDAFISRYRLEPKDPKAYRSGRLTEPKKQIVFYIDPATPKKWVKYLKLGIEDWNAAFEAAGFKNAIAAREWPTNDPTMSMEDARFSVLRYLPSETENAYGPRIVDPRSGEIIEAHICWYHNVMLLVKKWYMTQCGPLDRRAQSMDFPDELMGQLIRFVSSHEVGHSLGLRHNMIASSATPVEKLRDKQWVERNGHTSSIMDYARFNYVAQPEDGISERGLFPRIGDYDKWAIRWGYQWRPEFSDPQKEKKVLRKETTAALANPRLWWSGDEGRGQDPRSQTEDLGDNQMRANEYGLKNMRRVMDNIIKWTSQTDGQYDDLSAIHRSLRSRYTTFVGHVQKYLGGRYNNTAPGLKPRDYVPRELQREAVEWIGRNVLVAPLWLYPDEVVEKLGIDAADEIRSRQQTTLAHMLSPGLLYNIHEASLRSASPYRLEEYLDDVFSLVWKPIDDADERQNDFRRQQQHTYVAFLNRLLNPTAEDLKGTSLNITAQRSDVAVYAELHLDKLEQYLLSQPQEGTFNALHYKNLLLQVKKMRERHEKAE